MIMKQWESNLFLTNFYKYLMIACTLIAVFMVFVPFNPGMPCPGLDPSWVLAMNSAVAQKLPIGKAIMFTLGPYSSLYTHAYHPATDHLMIIGSLLLASCYTALLLYLVRETKLQRWGLYLVFLAFFMSSRDTLFFSYPLLLACSIAQFILIINQQGNRSTVSRRQLIIAALMAAPMGLLPLIKGSFLLIAAAMILLIVLYVLYYRYFSLAFTLLISPLVAIPVFWTLSGQPLEVLPSFFINLIPIISGYTEAMASQGRCAEIIWYLLASITIILAIIKSKPLILPIKLFLALSIILFLFIAFKSAFVRHDGHAMAASTALLFACLTINLIYPGRNRYLTSALWFSCIISLLISNHYHKINRHFFTRLPDRYRTTWYSLCSRITEPHQLSTRFQNSLNVIRKEYAIPTLPGTTDIYSHDQAYLLASNNQWNPRPILQSYSAYTPKLANINEQHLRNYQAPDNVLFAVQPIDGRLPSLEDGLSWPALLDNYQITQVDQRFAYFCKRTTIKESSIFLPLSEKKPKIGEKVELPTTMLPIYAEVSIQPTLLGKLLSIVFKPPQLRLQVQLCDGTHRNYRVIANMMRSGFFISPLIENTKDFVLLATNQQDQLKNHPITHLSISPIYGGALFWQESYQLILKSYQRDNPPKTSIALFNSSTNPMSVNFDKMD